MAKLEFKKQYTAHDPELAYNAMPLDWGIRKVLDDLGNNNRVDELAFLNNKSIRVTSIGMNYTPDFASYAQVAKALKKDENFVAQHFFNRPNKMVSENEWIFKDEIASTNDPLHLKSFVVYSAHMWVPGKNYSAACDISMNGMSLTTADAIIAYITKKYGTYTPDPKQPKNKKTWIYIFRHTVKGGVLHIHMEDKQAYAGYRSELIKLVNDACGYGDNQPGPIKQGAISANAAAGAAPGKSLYTPTNDECKERAQEEVEALKNYIDPASIPNQNAKLHEIKDSRTLLPDEVQDDGLMETLRIGDLDFRICPVTQVSYSQSMQYVRFSALRTVGDPKIANDTVPNNVTLNIIFPNIQAINGQLTALIAQFMATPITIVQNRFVARTIKPLIISQTNQMVENPFTTAEHESMWMIMTDLNVRSIPNFPESFEAFITFEPFEDRVFGNRMKFLAGYNDVKEKYRRKMTLWGNQYTLPSEKAMLSAAASFEPGVINVTADPKESKIYQEFYQSIQKSFKTYDTATYEKNGGKLTVLYNSFDFSRDSIRRVKTQMEADYNKSLSATRDLVSNLSPNELAYFQSKGLSVITGDQIKQIAEGTAEATIQQLQLAIQESSISKGWAGFRYSVMDPISKWKSLVIDADIYVRNIGKDIPGWNDKDSDQVLKIWRAALARVGNLKAWSEGLPSVFKKDDNGNPLRDKLNSDLPAAEAIGYADGSIDALETLIGETLFGEETDPAKINSRVNKIYTALNRLTSLCLNEVNMDKTGIDVDPDGLPKNPNQYQAIDITNGIDSFTTGISFSMSNKIVPQQVIGWRQPTFQHLGRSDWSINMNIVCKGDESLRRIMFIMNRMGVLSKQIQFTSPAKFVDLDTTLTLLSGDPIFGTLGIERVVLNTAEISSVPGQPNVYQISLGLEQSDLDTHSMESFEEAPFKQKTKDANDALASTIVPILKSLVIRPGHPNFGKFLNFQKIREVVLSNECKPIWQSYGLMDADGNTSYDYMDLYNFYKLSLGMKTPRDPSKNWDLTLVDLFPTGIQPDTYGMPESLTSRTTIRTWNKVNEFGANSTQVVEQQHNYISLKAFKNLGRLIAKEDKPYGVWPNGSLASPGNLTTAMERYFQGLDLLHKSVMNQIVASLDRGKGESSLGGVGLAAFLGGGSAAAAGATIALLVSAGPVGWAIVVGGVIAGAALGAGAASTANSGVMKIREMMGSILPAAFNNIFNTSVIDVAREFIADDSSLNIFNGDFQIGIDSNKKPITLQQKVHEIREAIAAGMKGCYNDFTSQIQITSQKTGIPVSVLDPAFYLFSDDFVTVNLIRETRIDVENRISTLASRACINALQLGDDLERRLKLNTDFDLNKSIPVQEGSLLTENDMKWAIKAKRDIARIHLDALEQANQTNLRKLKDINSSTEAARQVYLNEYWEGKEVAEKSSAFLETAFTRLQYVNAALRFDSIKGSLERATAHINDKMDKLKKDQAGSIGAIEYNILFTAKEYPENEKDETKRLTWYEAILEAGGIDNPYKYEQSINMAFMNYGGSQKKYGKTMYNYFTDFRMKDLLHQIEVIAKCKKAVSSNISSEMMTVYNGLDADPKALQKRIDEIQSVQDILFKTTINDVTGNPIRIFPTYKIYFIEEDAPEWGIFNDFYDYSAVQEITVVKDRKSASDTCVIKLSNVAGKLTDSFVDNIPEYGSKNLPLTSMMLKPGTSILVKMGYSNSQVDLPVVFYGIVIEVAPGPVVEIICQSYGAELNEVVAPDGGFHAGVFGDVKALGDVATWAIQQATGLNHFGKLGNADIGVSDVLRLSGTSTTGLQGKMKIASFITGLPGLSINDPRDDNIFLPYNMANITDKEFTSTTDGALSWLFDKWEAKGNLNFDWYIRDESIWQVLTELVWFSPDFIKTVLPYNDNLFPFVPKIRNTLYVGPRRGYYKYTDMFSTVSLEQENIEFPNAEKVASCLFAIGKYWVTKPIIINSTATGDLLEVANYITTELNLMISSVPEFNQLKSIFSSDKTIQQATETFFVINFDNPEAAKALTEEIGLANQAIEMAKKYLKDFTNYGLIQTQSRDDIKKNLQPDSNRSYTQALKRLVMKDVGMNGLYYNIYGNHHQYRKVQQHHIATAYTNILNNNIIASSEGWANQIKLVCPPDPKNYTTKMDVPIKERDSFITTTFNLDDNIFDDQIRTKEVFVNNIDPSMWDDSIWAKKVFKGEGTFTSIHGEEYASFDSDRKPKVKSTGPDIDGNTPPVDEEIKIREEDGSSHERTPWEQLPSRWRVGVSILAEEARDMYNGELTLIGDGHIRPFDVIHMIDYVNDMHGSFEVGRVIHTLSPQSGFTTRVKPDLIVNQKSRFTADELFIVSGMVKQSYVRSAWQFAGVAGGGITTGLFLQAGLGSLAALTKASALASLSSACSVLGVVGVVAGVGLGAYAGYKAAKYHHERIIMMMNNIVGRDSMEILPLTYRGVPYVAGVEGIKKDSYMRHMYSAALDDQNSLNIFERMGYMNAPREFEFYKNVAGDSSFWSFVQTNVVNPGTNGQSLPGTVWALKRGIFNVGE